MLHLLSLLWVFATTEPPASTLTSAAPRAAITAPADPRRGFTLHFDWQPGDPATATATNLLSIPGVLDVRTRLADPRDRDRQNYPAHRMPDGTVPVLEATLTLHSVEHPDWTNMTIGFPLARLRQPSTRHQVVLHFTGPDWKLYVDGECLDNDFPFGFPQWPDSGSWTIDPARVRQATLHIPALTPTAHPAPKPAVSRHVQYWVPPGHNDWVGDVATIFHQGRYHVFYLYDRRHHQSKFGCGAHYFEHLSTTDFRSWTEHEAATPLEEQWECIGTGTPFVHDGRLCLSYGLHTTRVYPRERTALPEQWEALRGTGHSEAFPRSRIHGFPAGSTYAVSADGVAGFRKSGVLIHPCENPSIFTAPDGNLRMMANYGAKGTWASDTLDGGWHAVNPDFPPGGDCTFFFRWGRFDYVIGGFTGLWSKPAEASDAAYADVVKQGLDFYDGLGVPAISGIGDGRYLMAGWLAVRGWGGCLVIRELLQSPDGRIGARWMPELTPRTRRARSLRFAAGEPTPLPRDARSFLLEIPVTPGLTNAGRLGIGLLPASGDTAAAELQLRLDQRRAQWSAGFADRFGAPEKSIREGGSAAAVENLAGTGAPFVLRVIVHQTDKLGGAVLDAEIAGQRTLITYRRDLEVQRLVFRAESARIGDVRLARFAD